MTIPPLWLLQADYSSTILEIQYDSGMPLTIVIVLMPFYKSVDTLCRFRGHPLTIPRTPFDDSVDILDDAVEKLRITDAGNLRIS